MSNKKKIPLINFRRGPLTPEKLRDLSDFDLSDEQAEEVIWTLTQCAWILYDFTIRKSVRLGSILNQKKTIVLQAAAK